MNHLLAFVTLGFVVLFADVATAADTPPAMKTYQMVFLRKGTNTNLSAADTA